MTIDSINVVFYTCIFLLPGYIIQEIISSLMPSKQYPDNVKLLRFLGYSILNLATWSWLYMIVLDELKSNQALHWILLSAITFITSCVTGFLIGIVRSNFIDQMGLILCLLIINDKTDTPVEVSVFASLLTLCYSSFVDPNRIFP